MKKAILELGKDFFHPMLIEYCETAEQLNDREKFWIKKYDAVQNREFYNLADGGLTVWGVTEKNKDRMRYANPMHDPEIVKKVSASLKGNIPWNKGKGIRFLSCQKCNELFRYKANGPKIFCSKSCAASISNKKRTGTKYKKRGCEI